MSETAGPNPQITDSEQAPTAGLRSRAAIAAARSVTTVLKAVGLRDKVYEARLDRADRHRHRLGPEDPGSWPAHNQMDRKLVELFGRGNPGFFVEAGANDGYTQSNTYWLERFGGWQGILVEPMEELAVRCRKARPDAAVVRAALVPMDFDGDSVEMNFGDLMSTVAGPHEVSWRTQAGTSQGWRDPYAAHVPARTLSAILDEHDAPVVDLLSLDVEGFEPQALAGLDLDRHAPRYVLVEIHEDVTGREPVEQVLGERYVLDRRMSPNDLLYRDTLRSA